MSPMSILSRKYNLKNSTLLLFSSFSSAVMAGIGYTIDLKIMKMKIVTIMKIMKIMMKIEMNMMKVIL